jgi:hypothetical protein
MILNTKPEGRCEVGRPEFGWLDDVEADIKTSVIKRWRLKDRTEWMVIVRKAKVKLKRR